ncbi:hypothetical protein ACH5RR_020618 [Cinchona calisaya]|uniref:Uncharacterized protein n=1 Tax=Cinchona calisaya TaxID=153742 RepID=A0ABD2ZFZ6_9GENT
MGPISQLRLDKRFLHNNGPYNGPLQLGEMEKLSILPLFSQLPSSPTGNSSGPSKLALLSSTSQNPSHISSSKYLYLLVKFMIDMPETAVPFQSNTVPYCVFDMSFLVDFRVESA